VTPGQLSPGWAVAGVTGVHHALTEDRRQQLDGMFDALPTEAARAAPPALAATSLQQLLAYVDAALLALRDDSGERVSGAGPSHAALLWLGRRFDQSAS